MTRPFRIETAPTATGSALVGKLAIAQARIEQSFLDGGNVLIAVMEAVSGLTEILDGIVNLLEPRATSQVFDSMKTVVSDLAELPGIADRKQVALIEISHLCDSVYSRVEDMREIIRYLRTIAITVKITGASIPEFSGFADEIRERIQTVSEEINRFGDQLVAMRNRLGAANASSAGVIRDFASAIPQLVENMDRSSVALAEQQKRMAASASQLKQITGSIQGKIATILSALQIGDVTRQRIEHVMSMFEFFERPTTPSRSMTRRSRNSKRRYRDLPAHSSRRASTSSTRNAPASPPISRALPTMPAGFCRCATTSQAAAGRPTTIFSKPCEPISPRPPTFRSRSANARVSSTVS
jgi:hypothetical protein